MIRAQSVVHMLVAIVGVVLLVALVVTIAQLGSSKLDATRFENAELCIEAPTATSLDREGLSALLLPPPTVNCTTRVTLPHRMPAAGIKFSRSGTEPIGRAWYKMTYTVPANWSSGEQLIIFSPRLRGLAWQLRLGDQIIQDNLDDWRTTFNRPLVVRLSSTRFHAGDQLTIAVGIAFQPQVGFSIARISAGPSSEVTPHVAVRQFLQIVMPFACTVMLLTMACFFFLFWWLRRTEPAHLHLSLSCIAWSVCNLIYVLPRHADPVLDAWYEAILGPSLSWVIWMIYLFVSQLDARCSRRLKVALPYFVLFMSLVALPIWKRFGENFGIVFQGLNVTAATLVFGHVGWLALRNGALEIRVIATALAIVVIVGAHDLALFAQVVNPESIFLLPYGGMLLFGSFLFALQRRYVRAIDDFERLSNSLAQRLTDRERELHANHSRLLELERAQTLAGERQRLMHEMHDGLGSALTTSIAMIEQGNVDGKELKGVLLESVDDLRAVIDSLEPLDGDLISVLATLRFRLGRRMELAGIELQWDMGELPSVMWLGPPQALQVIRIVQEILTNVLKHSGATSVRISTKNSDRYIEVCIADNGCGFDTVSASTAHGRGLRNLPKRAASLRGSLIVDSMPGRGTTVRLLLPNAVHATLNESNA